MDTTLAPSSPLTKAVHARQAAVPAGVDLAALRAKLPLQQVPAVREQAQATFGLAYGDIELGRILVGYLPTKLFQTKWIRCTPIASYPEVIPDAALARWDTAQRSGFFGDFCVVEPIYGHARTPVPRAVDPWLVGWLKAPASESGHRHGEQRPGVFKTAYRGRGHGIVLAYWE